MPAGNPTASHELPELAAVRWRVPASDVTLTRAARRWTLVTVGQTLPVIAVAGLLAALSPFLIPIALLLLIHAWIVGELYAARGAKVIRRAPPADDVAERTALGLLGDLVDHRARELHRLTGLVAEHGRLGTWLVGEKGALLVRPDGRRVLCYCVRVPDPDLPRSDRIAHLLLALRTDESGFATVANLAFAGARWRVRRRLAPDARKALDAAVPLARSH